MADNYSIRVTAKSQLSCKIGLIDTIGECRQWVAAGCIATSRAAAFLSEPAVNAAVFKFSDITAAFASGADEKIH
jgi:hypothetical protein